MGRELKRLQEFFSLFNRDLYETLNIKISLSLIFSYLPTGRQAIPVNFFNLKIRSVSRPVHGIRMDMGRIRIHTDLEMEWIGNSCLPAGKRLFTDFLLYGTH